MDNSFTQRMRQRHKLWWGQPFQFNSLDAYQDMIHRFFERFRFRLYTDPELSWQCCDRWQRTLINKWNGREFAKKHGCPVPELYWYGRNIWKVPLQSLPPQYVIRPVWGTGRKGVYTIANQVDLLRKQPKPNKDLYQCLLKEHGPISLVPILVEEFITDNPNSYTLPLEYKCHTFGRKVMAIQVLERTKINTEHYRYYTPDWELIDKMEESQILDKPRPAPEFLPNMLQHASQLGKAIGTYMRIDFFGSNKGPIFNEFSSVPNGQNMKYTLYGDTLFERFWQEELDTLHNKS